MHKGVHRFLWRQTLTKSPMHRAALTYLRMWGKRRMKARLLSWLLAWSPGSGNDVSHNPEHSRSCMRLQFLQTRRKLAANSRILHPMCMLQSRWLLQWTSESNASRSILSTSTKTISGTSAQSESWAWPDVPHSIRWCDAGKNQKLKYKS